MPGYPECRAVFLEEVRFSPQSVRSKAWKGPCSRARLNRLIQEYSLAQGHTDDAEWQEAVAGLWILWRERNFP
jgi:hypothetical protein